MRFTFIDDRGRKVGVASVEDLGAQIRHGAIGPSTQLYDSVEDRWAPAASHPVYVALSRDASPLGQVAPAGGIDLNTDLPLAEDNALSGNHSDVWTSTLKDEFRGAVPGETPGVFPEGSLDAKGSPSSPSDGPAGFSDGPAGFSDGPAGLSDGPAGTSNTPPGFNLGSGPPETQEGAPNPVLPPGSERPAPAPGSAGGMTPLGTPPMGDPSASGAPGSSLGGLSFDPVAPAYPSGALSDTGGKRDRGMGRIDGASTVFEGFDDPGGDLSGPEDGDGMKFEQFMPKPRSTEEGAPNPLGEGADSSLAGQGGGEDDDFFLIDDLSVDGEDTAPKRRTKRRSFSIPKPGKIGAVAGVGLIVVMGAMALPQLRSGSGGSKALEEDAEWAAPVESLPAYLRTEGVYLARLAHEDVVLGLDSIRRNLGLESAPPDDWMEGIYFAHASRYPGVQGYWERYRSYLGYAERASEELLERAFQARVSASGIRVDEQPVVTEAILAEFQRTRPARAQVFKELTSLADAALDLHEFLVLKEDDIEFAPFTRSGVSKDPILEAVPANDEVKREFWERLEDVTEGLEDLGALDRVTTERLQSILISNLERVAPS